MTAKTKYNVVSLLKEDVIAEALKKRAEESHYNCNNFNSKKEFLNGILDLQPDICFIGFEFFDDLDSFRLFNIVRKVLRADIPIIVISGNMKPSYVKVFMTYGASDCIPNNFTSEKISFVFNKFFNAANLSGFSDSMHVVPKPMQKNLCRLNLTVVAVTNEALVLHGPVLISTGTILKIKDKILFEIFGVEEMVLSVSNCQLCPRHVNVFDITADFINIDEAMLDSLKRYMGSYCHEEELHH